MFKQPRRQCHDGLMGQLGQVGSPEPEANPNDSPMKYVIRSDPEKITNGKILCCNDVSGSQQQNFECLKKQMQQVRRYHPHLAIQVFGQTHRQLEDGGLMSPAKYLERFYYPGTFKYQTFVHNLNKAIDMIACDGFNVLVIQGDGTFDDRLTFLRHLEKADLTNLKKLVLMYSPGTEKYIMDALSSDVMEILGKIDDAIVFEANELTRGEDAIKDVLDTCTVPVEETPHGFQRIGDLCMVHKDLTPQNIALVIQKKFPEMCKELLEFITSIIEKKPALLLSSDIYRKLHSVLKILLGKTYIDKISIIKTRATGEIRRCLTVLLQGSFYQTEELDEIKRKIGSNVIGYLRFSTEYSVDKILEIIRDGSNIKIIAFIQRFLQNAQYIERKKGTPIESACGMFVMIPTSKKVSKEEYKRQLRMAFSTMFIQWGPFLVNGSRLFLAGLAMLSSKFPVNTLIKKCLEGAFLDDPHYAMKMLGFQIDPEKDPEIPSLIYSEPIMGVLGPCICDKDMSIRLLGDNPLIDIICYMIERFYYTIRLSSAFRELCEEKISWDKQVPEETKKCIGIGAIVFITPWEGEEFPGLPACARVLKKGTKKNKGTFQCEYFDEPENSRDTYYIHPNRLRLISGNSSEKVDKNIRAYVMKMKEGMSKTPLIDVKNPADKETQLALRAKNDAELNCFIQKETGEVVRYKTKRFSQNIPPQILLLILKDSFGLKGLPQKLKEHLLKGKGVLKQNVIMEIYSGSFAKQDVVTKAEPEPEPEPEQVAEPEPEQVAEPDLQFNDENGDAIPIQDEDVLRIIGAFKKKMKLVQFDFAKGAKKYECMYCGDGSTKPSRFEHWSTCLHSMCLGCGEYLREQTKLKPGDFVNPAIYNCGHVECHVFNPFGDGRIQKIHDENDDELPTDVFLRVCSNLTCDEIFKEAKDCGMSPDDVPKFCEKHRLVTGEVRECPSCKTLVLKDGGCDHIHCTCGHHWCWRCRWEFSAEIIDRLDGIFWHCGGRCDAEKEKLYIEDSDYDSDEGGYDTMY